MTLIALLIVDATVTMGLISKLLFWKRYHLAEYVAIAFFITAFYIAVSTVMMLISHFVNPDFKITNFLILTVYITLVFPSFLGDRRFRVYFKSLLLSLLSIIFYMFLGFGFSLLVVVLRT